MNLDKAAKDAVFRVRDRQLKLLLELILGDMVALHGVKEIRRRILWHARHLKEFE